MLDDGLTYKAIIQSLGPAAQHLNEDNLSNWRLGGYQDYLKAQAIQDRAVVQTQAAADIVRESGTADPAQLRQVCAQMALLHYIETIADHGEQCDREAFKRNPAKLITLINACCNTPTSHSKTTASPTQPHPPPHSAFSYLLYRTSTCKNAVNRERAQPRTRSLRAKTILSRLAEIKKALQNPLPEGFMSE